MTFASAKIFNAPIRVDIMHRVVHWHLAGLRAGTASTKHRSDVRGSTRKIYQQKGLGRARAGSIRANQRRGGARCFGPKPRKFYYTLPEKVRNLGLRSALSTKFSQGQLSFVSDASINLDSHKTGCLAEIIVKIPAKRILLIDSVPPNKNLMLAARSLNNSIVLMNVGTDKINVYHVLKSQFVLLTDRARQYYEQHFDSLPY
jgi:large subunit ribosomal protein L4